MVRMSALARVSVCGSRPYEHFFSPRVYYEFRWWNVGNPLENPEKKKKKLSFRCCQHSIKLYVPNDNNNERRAQRSAYIYIYIRAQRNII